MLCAVMLALLGVATAHSLVISDDTIYFRVHAVRVLMSPRDRYIDKESPECKVTEIEKDMTKPLQNECERHTRHTRAQTRTDAHRHA